MTRDEYNEFRYIRKSVNEHSKYGMKPGPGCLLTIRTNASPDYKHRLDTLYTSLGFHPASVKVDKHMLDENERIIYLYGRTFDCNGEIKSWEVLYTKEEKARFEAALNS